MKILKKNLIDEDRENICIFVRSLGKETKCIDLSESLTRGNRTQILYSQFETFNVYSQNLSSAKLTSFSYILTKSKH